MPKYILKNKDKTLLCFEVQIKSEEITRIWLEKDALLPRNLGFGEDSAENNRALKKWICRRKVPSHRENFSFIMQEGGILSVDESSFVSFLDVSLALSLIDSFWIVPENSSFKWSEHNLYENKFNENIARAAFGAHILGEKSTAHSGEFTTDGVLRKAWQREDGKIYLYKGASGLYGNANEPYSEFYAAQVAEVMGFSHVSYDLAYFHGDVASKCEIFTSQNEGFAPIWHFMTKAARRQKSFNLIGVLLEIYEDKGALYDLLLFDALVGNVDRHLGNFGMVVDNETGVVLRPAPIFDNGLSVLKTAWEVDFYLPKLKESFESAFERDLYDLEEYMKFATSAFDMGFDSQLEFAVKPRHIPNLERLAEFEFNKHPLINLQDDLLLVVQKMLQNRAKKALKIAQKKKTWRGKRRIKKRGF